MRSRMRKLIIKNEKAALTSAKPLSYKPCFTCKPRCPVIKENCRIQTIEVSGKNVSIKNSFTELITMILLNRPKKNCKIENK